jgi:beta propeller repeat protein
MAVGIAHAETRSVPSGEYQTIQSAIAASEDGDVVVVSPGVYFERINFRGKDITVTSTDPDDPRVVGYTVLNGEGEGTVVTFSEGETAQAVLAGFTITGGYGTLNPELGGGGGGSTESYFMGGGVYCNRSSPTITKNVIVRNEGPLVIDFNTGQVNISYGGGIGVWDGSPTMTYNTIRNNGAYVGGGGICFYGQPTFHNNMVFENSAHLGGGFIAFGGDIYNNTFVRNDSDYGTQLGADLGPSMGGNLYMVFAPELGGARVFNNIIASAPSGGGLFWEGDASAAVIAFNDVWGNTPGDYGYIDPDSFAPLFGGEGDQTGLLGNISEDPLFLASMSKNFHLTLDSPCINTGDPDFVPPAGQIDIDGEDRIYAARIDMGADEYVGYVKPVASAGFGVHILESGEIVTLDGRDSFFYDPADIQTYRWSQVSGPEVVLDGSDSALPTFSPPEAGTYVFALVVGDSRYESEPDQVLVFVGPNRLPVASAGSDKVWQTPGQVALDGTGSYDPDPVDHLTYTWTQMEGPTVTLENADTATPTFAAEPGGQYLFQLVVSDGFENSLPSQVRLVTVGGSIDISPLSIEPVEGRYPRYPDISGSRVVFAGDSLSGYSWRITYRDFRTQQTAMFGSGGMNTQPKIEGDLVVWAGDVRISGDGGAPVNASVFARNLATEVEVTLRGKSDTESFSHPAISGDRVVWVQHVGLDTNTADQWRNMPYDICGADVSDMENPTYFTIATSVGQRDPFPVDDLYNDYDDVVDIDGNIVVWEGNGDIYAADISDLGAIRVFVVCADEGRQYDPSVSGSYVVWTDERNGEADIYGADISDSENVRVFEIAKQAGSQRQPVVEGPMVVFIQGATTGGQIGAACITRQYGVMDVPIAGVAFGLAPVLDGANVAWITDTTYGGVQGVRVAFGYSIFDGTIENITTGERYDYLQHAVSDALPGGEVVVPEGVYQEHINFAGRAVTVRSTDPTDPVVVAATILQADGDVVTFAEEETANSVLDGLTIAGGSRGIFLSRALPTIKRCTITSNRRAGAFLVNRSMPTFAQCRIVANGGAGIEIWIPSDTRTTRPSTPTLQNSIVSGNRGAGIQGGKLVLNNCTVAENLAEGITSISPTITNSIICFNDSAGAGVQIGDERATVTYSNIQGNWPGTGNLDVDPAFAALGQWTEDGWVAGDYHLQSQGYRWDDQAGQWTSDETTSPCIDAGDPASALLDEPVTMAGDVPVTNERINMGAYGGTVEASVAPAGN